MPDDEGKLDELKKAIAAMRKDQSGFAAAFSKIGAELENLAERLRKASKGRRGRKGGRKRGSRKGSPR